MSEPACHLVRLPIQLAEAAIQDPYRCAHPLQDFWVAASKSPYALFTPPPTTSSWVSGLLGTSIWYLRAVPEHPIMGHAGDKIASATWCML
jgi:hypothetical protein